MCVGRARRTPNQNRVPVFVRGSLSIKLTYVTLPNSEIGFHQICTLCCGETGGGPTEDNTTACQPGPRFITLMDMFEMNQNDVFSVRLPLLACCGVAPQGNV